MLIANIREISILLKQFKSKHYYRENNLDKIKSQVSESVKMLMVGFKRSPNAAIENNIFRY